MLLKQRKVVRLAPQQMYFLNRVLRRQVQVRLQSSAPRWSATAPRKSTSDSSNEQGSEVDNDGVGGGSVPQG